MKKRWLLVFAFLSSNCFCGGERNPLLDDDTYNKRKKEATREIKEKEAFMQSEINKMLECDHEFIEVKNPINDLKQKTKEMQKKREDLRRRFQCCGLRGVFEDCLGGGSKE